MDSCDNPCSCWLSLEGMNLADLKAALAPDFDVQPAREGGGL
jgi:hypothetical protein